MKKIWYFQGNKFDAIFFLFKYFFNIVKKHSYNSYDYFNNSKNINALRKYLFNSIYIKKRQNITNINLLFIKGAAQLGNFFVCINNAIIFCELLGCKKLIIEKNNNSIFYKKYNFTIEPNHAINCLDNNCMILRNWFFYHLSFKYLGDVDRLYILKKEIFKNLPKVKSHKNDLYIYIRSGDIFYKFKPYISSYSQPPLCFYQNILNNFNFRYSYIISKDKLNPVIPNLLNEYSFLKFKKNNLKYDVAYLANSFNIVSAKSSFLISIIKLNDKLKFLWEYGLYSLSEKYLHLHYSVYSFSYSYTIYKMEPSSSYRKLMAPWVNSKEQKEMMIKEKCNNYFSIIGPRFWKVWEN